MKVVPFFTVCFVLMDIETGGRFVRWQSSVDILTMSRATEDEVIFFEKPIRLLSVKSKVIVHTIN